MEVRAARRDDPAAALLHVSAEPYYDAFAGSAERAVRLLASLWPQHGHSASYDVCRVALVDGTVAGVLAAFPLREGDPRARRFLRLAAPRLPLWQWPRTARHLIASARVTPNPPAGSFYVDALAVAEGLRRRGVATALLHEAERAARLAGASSLALDTGFENEAGQRLYEAFGFRRTGERRAPDERAARAIGGRGFVSYVKAI